MSLEEIYARLTALEEENKLLRIENAALKEMLRQRDVKIEQLETQVRNLRIQLGQNSGNSSKPPSSDPPWKPKQPTQEKSEPAKKAGGQKGHKGEHRALVPTLEVDHIHKHLAPDRCRTCAHNLVGVVAGEPLRRQVTELPEVKAEVHEHQAEVVCCPNCGTRNSGTFPKETELAFGTRLTASVALLSGFYRLSKRNVQSILHAYWKVEMSLGAVSNCEAVLGETLKESTAEARAYVQRQAVVGADETSWIQGKSSGWLWVASTNWVSVFLIQTRRNAAAAQRLLGAFAGVLLVDRFGGYRWFKEKRQFCWAHLLRDFRALSENDGPGQIIGKALYADTQKLFKLVNHVRDGTSTVAQFQDEMKFVQSSVETLLAQGREVACKATNGKCKTLWKERDCLWPFIESPLTIPVTNNRSEQDLRHAVILRKTSYRTQSERGSRFIERMLTVVKSLQSQKRNVLDFLVAAMETRNLGTASPSLLPQPAAQ